MQHRNILSGDPLDPRCERAVRTMATGGDARITLDRESGLNRYLCAPRPSPALAYASSTANDLSIDAFDHVLSSIDVAMSYGAALDAIRDRIRAAYDLRSDTGIVIAPSGTDLEYVGLAVARDRAPGGILNILLGADEVGSGCVNSAHGRFFAEQTALGIPTVPGAPVDGLGLVELTDIAVRDQQGRARHSGEIADHIDAAATTAAARGLHTVVHVVHGSKTGLVLPEPEDLDGLIARHGDTITIVVDACQARITPAAIAFYLARGAIVLLTGSKFMGGPPFSGFALVPAGTPMPTLPAGFAHIFARAEWPVVWPGRDLLPDRPNPGLRLRLSAAIHELERFRRLPMQAVRPVTRAFHDAVRVAFVDRLGARLVDSGATAATRHAACPIETQTLVTIDLSTLPGRPDFDAAQTLHKRLAGEGLRVGQPVRCVPTGDGWGGTLRIALSMPQICDLAILGDACADRLAGDLNRIADRVARLIDQ